MALGSRAQAAITDSIFLLVIVASLSALMFFFITGTPPSGGGDIAYPVGRGSGYGVSVERIALEFYGTDYATSALQTLMYSSTPRHEGETLEEAKEIDYLLAFLKEDYANDQEFDDITKDLFLHDLNLIMASSLPVYDFVFYMHTLPGGHYELPESVFVLLKYTDFSATPEPERVYYFCELGPGKVRHIEERLLSRAGAVVKAQPVILRFPIEGADGIKGSERIFTALDMWPATELPKAEVIEAADSMNCTKAV